MTAILHRLALALIVLIVASDPTAAKQRRSQGYAGTLPVGHDDGLAFSRYDCAKIRRDPRRSQLRVPLSYDCAVDIPSPDRRLVAHSTSDGDTIALRISGGLTLTKLEQPVMLLWNPRSNGFLLNDGEGSGQTSRLRYFAYRHGRWRESRELDRRASQLYLRRYDCRRNENPYTNVSGWQWLQSGQLRAIVQEGVHSAGCLQPHEDRNVMLEVIGDPVTGRIARARELSHLD